MSELKITRNFVGAMLGTSTQDLRNYQICKEIDQKHIKNTDWLHKLMGELLGILE